MLSCLKSLLQHRSAALPTRRLCDKAEWHAHQGAPLTAPEHKGRGVGYKYIIVNAMVRFQPAGQHQGAGGEQLVCQALCVVRCVLQQRPAEAAQVALHQPVRQRP